MNTPKETEFDKVLKHAGGVSKLAHKIKVSQGVVSGWKTRGVSRDGALAIENEWPRKFKAVRLAGTTATKCFERRRTATSRNPSRRAKS